MPEPHSHGTDGLPRYVNQGDVDDGNSQLPDPVLQRIFIETDVGLALVGFGHFGPNASDSLLVAAGNITVPTNSTVRLRLPDSGDNLEVATAALYLTKVTDDTGAVASPPPAPYAAQTTAATLATSYVIFDTWTTDGTSSVEKVNTTTLRCTTAGTYNVYAEIQPATQ